MFLKTIVKMHHGLLLQRLTSNFINRGVPNVRSYHKTMGTFNQQQNVKPLVTCYFHQPTNSCTYVLEDENEKNCVIIDPVLDFNFHLAKTWTEHADKIVTHVKNKKLNNQLILETHCHADHITAATYLKSKIGGQIAIGKNISVVVQTFNKLFNLNETQDSFDKLFSEGDTFNVGSIKGTVFETPGHTPACVTYHIGDCVFVGDTLFMPDFGCSRCDFPGGSAEQLYNSITRKIFTLPDSTRLFVCHDYLPQNGRKEYRWETTIGEEKSNNLWINQNTQLDQFVKRRKERDVQLDAPLLILPSLQMNLRAGKFPQPEQNGRSYLKLPINFLK